jgi:hypothetical protein
MKTTLAYLIISILLVISTTQCKTKKNRYKSSDEYKEQLLEDSLRKHI